MPRTELKAPDRRRDEGVVYDREARRLHLGSASLPVPAGADNRAVLGAYVELVGRCRGERPSVLPQVRDIDLAALVDALDLEAADLVAAVEVELGTGPLQARRLVSRLRDHRVVTGIAAAALAATMAGTVASAGIGSSPAGLQPVPAARPVATAPPALAPTADVSTADDASQPGGPITEHPDGVGLIPPLVVDDTGVTLIAPASTEPTLPPPGSTQRTDAERQGD